MDFLNQTFSQTKDLFRSMTPGARITAGLLLTVVVVSLGYLFTHQISGSDTFLMNGEHFAPSQLPAMEAAFDKAGLKDYEVEGTRIKVPRGRQSAYMGALADANALPRNFHDYIQAALKESSPFLSKQQQAARLKSALQQELSQIVGAMRGIERAVVLYDSETTGGLRRETITKASVNVQASGSDPLDEQRIAAIRHSVAAAIAGLKPESVTVTDLGSGRVYPGGQSDGPGSVWNNLYGGRKKEYELSWRKKVQEALARVPGVDVSVNVVLDREKFVRKSSVTHDPKPVAYSTSEEMTEMITDAGVPAGQPGYQAQLNTGTAATSRAKGTHEESTASTTRTDSALSSNTEDSELVGLTPKQVTASIAVPKSYFEDIWRRRNPAAEGSEPQTPDANDLAQIEAEEVAKIRKHVLGLIPVPEGITDPNELVTVTTFDDFPAEAIPEPGLTENAMAWAVGNWSTLGLGVLALFSLVMLRSMVRSGATVTETGGSAATRSEGSDEEENEIVKAQNRLRRFAGGEVSLRDELTDLVEEDPDAAANILSTWIGSAG